MPPTLPDNSSIPANSKELGAILAATLFANFRQKLGEFELNQMEIFGIVDNNEKIEFLTSLHTELLCMIITGVINGISVVSPEFQELNTKTMFLNAFERSAKLLETTCPNTKFMVYSMEKPGGEPTNFQEGS